MGATVSDDNQAYQGYFWSNCTRGVSIYFSGRAADRSGENRMEDGMGRVNYMLFYLLSFITSVNIGCCNPSSVGFRYFCSARALITTVILRAGSLEKLLIC